MAASVKTPNRLYKYRSFSNLTLEMLVSDTLYFADPSSFNDPLDTKPSLETDLGADQLAAILSRLVEQRSKDEMTAAAKTIKYRGPKTVEHIARHSRRVAEQLIERIRYEATNPDYEIADPEQYLFGQYVEAELLRRYNSGVVSLAERAVCPLMWSHYGDQHNGLCIGYSAPADALPGLHVIRYGGSRMVKASVVARMLDGDSAARTAVDGAVLLRKAMAWGYEKEWRLIGPRGVNGSPLEMEEVVFGMRCTAAVKYAVVKALEDRDRTVRFYEIREQPGRFTLVRRAMDTDELKVSFPHRARSIHEAFADLTDLD